MLPLMKTIKTLGLLIGLPPKMRMSSTPLLNAVRMTGASSTSVVMCVISAKFLTKPHAYNNVSSRYVGKIDRTTGKNILTSPSGVSLGHNIPH